MTSNEFQKEQRASRNTFKLDYSSIGSFLEKSLNTRLKNTLDVKHALSSSPGLVEDSKQQNIELMKRNIRSNRSKTCVKDYDTLAVIGVGSCSHVRLVRNQNSGTLHVLKVINKRHVLENGILDQIKNEAYILSNSHSSHLIQAQSIFQDKKNLYMLTDWYPGGDLASVLGKYGRLGESQTAYFIANILNGLIDLHCLHYIHRDIKPDNILLNEFGEIYICDFGSSCRLSDIGNTEYRIYGCVEYMAVEMFEQGVVYDVSVDFWALGVVMYECLVGETPFHNGICSNLTIPTHDLESTNLLNTISKIIEMKSLNYLDTLSPEAIDLMNKFSLICPPGERLKVTDIIDHDFLKKHGGFDYLVVKDPPIIPKLESVADTGNFPNYDDLELANLGQETINLLLTRQDLMFLDIDN